MKPLIETVFTLNVSIGEVSFRTGEMNLTKVTEFINKIQYPSSDVLDVDIDGAKLSFPIGKTKDIDIQINTEVRKAKNHILE